MLSPVVLVLILSFVYLWLKYGRVRSSWHPLPPAVPGKLPIIGHGYLLFQYFTNLQALVKYLAENCTKQGGVTYFNFGRELYYLITDPEDALTAANLCTQKHYTFEFGKDWMGDGITISSGEVWKRHRKLVTPAFTLPVVHSFLDVFNSQSKKLACSLEPHIGKGPFDQFPYLKINALETLCIGTFGINPIDDVEFTQRYMEAVDTMLYLAVTRGIKFWLQINLIYMLVGLKKKEEEVLRTLHAMANAVLQKKKAAMRHDTYKKNGEPAIAVGSKYKPFLDLILDLSKNGAFTEKDIRDEMNSFITAGYETTSNQLTSILVLIGAHPDVQEKMYQEAILVNVLCRLLAILGPDRNVEKDDINKLVYTNAVLMECLRVYPSVPIIIRSVLQDSKLKNYTMRAGSHCIIFPLATHMDPTWGAESDKFRPERWLDGKFINNKEFAAFGLGKRACVGRTYSMISMKVTLAHFLRQYRVKADVSKLKMKYDFIMKPVSGHEISLERRT